MFYLLRLEIGEDENDVGAGILMEREAEAIGSTVGTWAISAPCLELRLLQMPGFGILRVYARSSLADHFLKTVMLRIWRHLRNKNNYPTSRIVR